MRQRSVRRRQRSTADVQVWIKDQGGREAARQCCMFFEREIEDAELARALIAEFGAELEPWSGIFRRLADLEREQP